LLPIAVAFVSFDAIVLFSCLKICQNH